MLYLVSKSELSIGTPKDGHGVKFIFETHTYLSLLRVYLTEIGYQRYETEVLCFKS